MEKLAAQNGEVVMIAVDPARGRVVACTSDCDAAVLEHGGPGEASSALVRSALESMKADWSPDLHAAFIAGRLYLSFGSSKATRLDASPSNVSTSTKRSSTPTGGLTRPV